MNLYQKIVEIRKSVDVFTKDTPGHKYTYVSGTQVLSKIKNKIDELGIVLEPHVLHDTVKCERINKNIMVTAEMEYHWVNAENPEERIVVPWVLLGEQNDPSKAFGSGLTYSERYFLLKYLGVPTDDEDPDTRQGEKNAIITVTADMLSDICKEKNVPEQQLIDRYGRETGKKITDIKYLKQDYKQKYYLELQRI